MKQEPMEVPASEVPASGRPSVFPKKMIGLTILVMAVITLGRTFRSELTDFVGISPDVAQVSTYLLILLLLMAWTLWTLFFSGAKWWKRIVVAALVMGMPFAFLKVMRPVNDGDAGIVRFEPIWKSKRVLTTEGIEPSGTVDLNTETPIDFARFLGPNQNADVTYQGELSDQVIDTAEIVWKQEIGEGWSGFAARNGFAVTMEQRGRHECITCYEVATGKIQWMTKYETRHRDFINMGRAGPRSTPTIHKGKVYAVGGVGNFVCLDGATGKEIWKQDLCQILGIGLLEGVDANGDSYQYEDSTLAWGRAGSPLIFNDVVIVPGGGPRDLSPGDALQVAESSSDIVPDASEAMLEKAREIAETSDLLSSRKTLLAFDLESGELRWKAGSAMIGYGSPSLYELGGRQQITIVGESEVVGFDASSGAELWTHPRPGSSEGPANCSQVTRLSDNQILLSKGYNMGGEIVDIVADGDRFKAVSVKSDPRVLKTKLTSPVVKDGYAYSLSDGFLECADVSDLSRKWKKRGRFGHGQLLLCGDKLIVHSENGRLFLVRATPEKYEELGSLKTIDGVCWNTICRHGDYLLVRSELEAACIRLGQ